VRIVVRLFATLRRYRNDIPLGEGKEIDVPPGATLAEVRDLLGLPPAEVKLVMRNHIHADFADQIAEGDRVTFIPAVAGG
jgi:molybdopterin converting factor small subunit